MDSVTNPLLEDNKSEYFDQLFIDLNHSITIHNTQFENCRFKDCNFDNSKLLSCKFVDCEFTNCSMNTITLTDTIFLDVSFDRSKLMGIDWTKAKWPQFRLSNTLSFYLCNVSHSYFFGLNLSEINIHECKAHDVDFREADLSYSNLLNSDFYHALFIHTNLTGADFSEAINYNIDLTLNKVKNATFTFPDVINLLNTFEININLTSESDLDMGQVHKIAIAKKD